MISQKFRNFLLNYIFSFPNKCYIYFLKYVTHDQLKIHKQQNHRLKFEKKTEMNKILMIDNRKTISISHFNNLLFLSNIKL